MSSANFAACAPRAAQMADDRAGRGSQCPWAEASAAPHAGSSRDCHDRADRRTNRPWPQSANATPVLFDRALLRVRQDRARKQGAGHFPARPRRRGFFRPAGCGEARIFRCRRSLDARRMSRALPRDVSVGHARRARSDSETLPLAAGIARSRRLRAGAAIRQRSAGRARANPPRAEARRAVAGGDDRRRYAHRTAAILCRGRSRMRGRRVAARCAVRRFARRRPSACSAQAWRCPSPMSTASWCATTTPLR